MDYVTEALRLHPLLVWLWRFVVFAGVAYLMILGALIFIRPALVMRFFEGLAVTGRVNFLEALLRIIVGVALVGTSPETKAPVFFFGFGAVLVLTSIPLMFLHELHRRQAVWVIPLVRRILPLMGLVAIALGAFIAWAATRY
jgi:hypothetical protein